MAAGVKGMAAGNSAESSPSSADGAVFLNSKDKVGTTRGVEAAITADEWAQCPLIRANRGNQ
jgi:hypothetical protein